MSSNEVNSGDTISRIIHQVGEGIVRDFISPTKVKVIFPGGLSYQTYDRLGAVTPWGLMKMIEASRTAIITPVSGDPRTFLDLGEMTKRYLYFIVGTHFRAEPELYDLDLAKTPIWVETDLVHVGRTSFTTGSKLFVKNISKPLMDSRLVCVLVDPVMRKTVALPDWWLGKFASPEIRAAKPFRLHSVALEECDGEAIPEYVWRVPFSDSDFNLHANFTSYVKFCYDAFMANILNQKNSALFLSRSINVKELSMVYKGEVDVGEEIVVKLQQDRADRNTFDFHTFRSKTSTLINECRIEFYASSLLSKL